MSLATPLPDSGQIEDGWWPRAEQAVALLAAFLIGSRMLISTQITLGYLAAFALTPLWFPLVRRVKPARVLMVSGFLALAFGVVLMVAAQGQRQINPQQGVVVMIEFAGVLATAATIYWALHKVSLVAGVTAYALGMLVFVNFRSELFSSSPWRFGFALPVSILLLALLCQTKRSGPQMLGLAVLIGASVIAGARSPVGIQLIVLALLWLWSLRGKELSRSRSVTGAAVWLVLLAYAAYSMGQALLLEGFLGDTAQQRTESQVEASGTLILGGRPEIGATAALLVHNPWGFGPGVSANWYDVQAARNGMAAIGYDPLNGYVDNYLFGDVIRLHSIFGELWAAFGPFGLLVAGVLLWTAIAAIALGPRGYGDGLTLFLAVQTLWNIFFSPWYTSISVLVLLLPLVWLRSRSAPAAQDQPGLAPPAAVAT